MRCGIIDVGSNTIRLSIYEYDKYDMEVLMHKKTMAGLLNHVKNGVLQPEGIVKLCSVLKTYRSILDNLGINNRHCFATASLRSISNRLEVLVSVKAETGFAIEIIKGEEEARLDFIGATKNIPADEGIIVDIGGGSTELILYKEDTILGIASLPLGSLSLYLNYVKRLLPKEKDREAITKEVIKALDHLPQNFYNKDVDCSVLCGIGGAIRAANAIHRSMNDIKSEKRVMTINDLDKVLVEINGEKKESLLKILKVRPDRVHTVVPGMIILKCIMQRFSCHMICVSRFGVREGYIKEYIIAKNL